MVRRVRVYRRSDGLYMHSWSQSTAGVWLAVAPYIKLPLGESPAEIGAAVLRALEASRHGVLHPTHPSQFEGRFKPMLDLAAVSSWAKFMKGCPSIGVEDAGAWFTMEPWRNAGPRGGYTPLVEKYFHIPHDSTTEEIANAVQRALNLCE